MTISLRREILLSGFGVLAIGLFACGNAAHLRTAALLNDLFTNQFLP